MTCTKYLFELVKSHDIAGFRHPVTQEKHVAKRSVGREQRPFHNMYIVDQIRYIVSLTYL